MNNNILKKELGNYAFIITGCIFLALGVVWFFVPNDLLTGGTAGLSLLLHYVSPYSIGTLMIAVNLPLLLIGYKYLGKMFAFRTIVTIVLISIFIDLFVEVLELEAVILDKALASIFGGAFIGLGLALVIKGNSSAGGSTIIARIVSSKSEIKPSTVILCIDFIIITSALFIFEDKTSILWSIISIYVTTKVIDFILTGSLNKKVVHLVTNKVDLFTKLIKEELGPEGTVISGQGFSNNEEKKIILLVVEVTKLQSLREMIIEHDKDAFMIISEANEMLGRGH